MSFTEYSRPSVEIGLGLHDRGEPTPVEELSLRGNRSMAARTVGSRAVRSAGGPQPLSPSEIAMADHLSEGLDSASRGGVPFGNDEALELPDRPKVRG